MTLRAIAGENPTMSVATDAELLAVETGFLLDGDRLWSSQSGEYIYRPNSTAALSATVLAAEGSNGGVLAGRLIFTGTGPNGSSIQASMTEFTTDQVIASNVLTGVLPVIVTTTAANEKVDVSISIAGHATAAASILTAALAVGGVTQTTSGGFTLSSTGATDWVSGSLRKILTFATAGTYTITVQLAVAVAVNSFTIPAGTQATSSNGVVVAVRLGVV